MREGNLTRIKKESKGKGIVRYRIFGLNLLAANTTHGDPNLLALQSDPILKFLGTLIQCYQTMCLLGSPAPDNWMNEMRAQGKAVTIDDFLGKETHVETVPFWYYGGTFGTNQKYGPSLLFKLHGPGMLVKLGEAFMGWDAVALLLYQKGKDGLRTAQNALTTFTTEEALIETILRDARYLILTQADCQYLEVYTRAADVEPELHTAAAEAEAYIKSTAWYQQNKGSLVWDEQELCYVKR
ncbi:MAG: hypothetical protein ACREIQ_07330 [Nitrospiria bacterium]